MTDKESNSLKQGNQSGEAADFTPVSVSPDGTAAVAGESMGAFRSFIQKHKVGEFFQKYTMVLALFLVILVFSMNCMQKIQD